MKSLKIKIITRVLLIICAFALIIVLKVPMWRIELNAPQYPEGLKLLIYPNKLSGNVDIINGLNHYIGMKNLRTNDFTEFSILPGIIIFFIAAFILVALIGKRRWLNLLFIIFVSFGIIAMFDFWRWEYDYGHHLNPEAAIIVPGMAYQPPLIGFKQLLNFGAYSVPDKGGWIFVSVGAMLLLLVFFEWYIHKIGKKPIVSANGIILVISLLFLSSCSTSPDNLKIGRDDCSFCKMTISDIHYGAELITRKGKVYKFDDTHCMLSFIQSNAVDKKELANVYFTDFSGKHSLLKESEALLVQSKLFKGPMNGNIAAFINADSVKSIAGQYTWKVITWKELNK